MNNDIAKRIEGTTFDQMLQQADLFVKSGFFPKHVDTKEKAVVIMLKGRELGLPFTEALSKISVIQGIATTKVETMLGLARRTGLMEDFKIKYHPNEIAPEYCEVTIKRKGQSAHVCRFGDAEARNMTSSEYDKATNQKRTICLFDKDNYKKQKATMYQWRAIAKNLRVTFPDAIGGLYLEEEIANDVVLIPATPDRPADVEEVVTITDQSIPEVKPNDVSIETLPGEDVPEEQLPNFVIPFGKYKGMTIGKIMEQTTENGKAVGREYLEWLGSKGEDQKIRTVIKRFFQAVRA